MKRRRRRALVSALIVLGLLGGLLYFLVGEPQLHSAASRGEAGHAADRLQEALLGLKVWIALLEKMGMEAMDLRIDTEGNRVFLRGAVASASAERMAREVAASVDGVGEVKSEIRLRPAEGGSGADTVTGVKEKAVRTTRAVKREVGDALLEARIKTKLLSEVGANAMRIDVEASRGMVSLKGAVKSHEVKTLALAAARGTTGVRGVVDLMTEVPPPN